MDDVVAEVREWRRRMGGTRFGLWPGAASSFTCLRRRLPDPPQTPMLHLVLRTGPDEFRAAVRSLAEGGLWTWERPMATGVTGLVRVELPVGDATMALRSDEIREAVATLAGQASWGRCSTWDVGVLLSGLAHERQRQAPGWLPGNLYSV